jgi:integrase
VSTDIVSTADVSTAGGRGVPAGDRGGPVPPPVGPARVETRFAPRAPAAGWSSTSLDRERALERLTGGPFALDSVGGRKRRRHGVTALLDWLGARPGQTWQDRWLASGADAAGAAWRDVPAQWLRGSGRYLQARADAIGAAVTVAICADLVRPSTDWLVAAVPRGGALVRGMAQARDPEGFARLRRQCEHDAHLPAAGTHTLHRAAVILGAKGGVVAEITVGDVLELLDAEVEGHRSPMGHATAFYRTLHQLGIFSSATGTAAAPSRLQELRSTGQRTPAQLIDRFDLACRPVRDLLVDYLCERAPALDYSSLRALAADLGNVFWKDLERHHPGIDSLHLLAPVAAAWKQRLRTRAKTVTTAAGEKTTITVERLGYRQCLTPVRAFYLDLAQWAFEDPARWAPWVAPCPIGEEEINQRKAARQRKSRMDARTRQRLPVLPILVRSVEERRRTTDALLQAARGTRPGECFVVAGQTFTRSVTTGRSAKVWIDDPTGGRRRDLAMEEDLAFWAWATVEVLRTTGVRIEELLEITHHSLVQYRLPGTGELVPLLQIAPSKTDVERLLVISPELADVLSTIIRRVRGTTGTVPVIPAYDRAECLWLAPAPWLFQRRLGTEHRRICPGAIRNMLNTALAHSPLTDPETGGPLHFTPHDFRRMFITDAILSGLPPHIAQIIAGHRDINVTMGYKAVYPDEAIQAHLAFLARRRALRPSEEYRVPTDDEWTEFLGHFERRKVSTGTCGRAFGTPCIHEHACIRCSMLWPDPAQRERLVEIRDNLTARIAEAQREGWLGDVEGLQVSLAGANHKLAQLERRTPRSTAVDLGIPALTPRS